MKHKSRLPALCLLLYTLALLYITLFSRSRSLMSVVHLDALWTYKLWFTRGWYYVKQALLNIALFAPFGWLLSAVGDAGRAASGHQPGAGEKSEGAAMWKAVGRTVLLCFLSSVFIEAVQFFSGRGSLDVDDLINNSLGGLIGAAACGVLGNRLPKKPMLALMVLAGAAGCFMIRPNHFDYNTQFFFDIDQVEVSNGLRFSGACFSNGARTPVYSLVLRDAAGKTYPVETETTGRRFLASATLNAAGEGEYEVLVNFRLFPVISTGTWLHDGRVKYVAGEPDEPENAAGILRAYSPEYDTFVYQDGDRIVWYIGYDIDPDTEILYHIFTNDGEQLPADRAEYGYDNRGFRPGGAEEQAKNGRYRVFEKEIPSEFPVTSIRVGFNPGDGVTWAQSFRIKAS